MELCLVLRGTGTAVNCVQVCANSGQEEAAHRGKGKGGGRGGGVEGGGGQSRRRQVRRYWSPQRLGKGTGSSECPSRWRRRQRRLGLPRLSRQVVGKAPLPLRDHQERLAHLHQAGRGPRGVLHGFSLPHGPRAQRHHGHLLSHAGDTRVLHRDYTGRWRLCRDLGYRILPLDTQSCRHCTDGTDRVRFPVTDATLLRGCRLFSRDKSVRGDQRLLQPQVSCKWDDPLIFSPVLVQCRHSAHLLCYVCVDSPRPAYRCSSGHVHTRLYGHSHHRRHLFRRSHPHPCGHSHPIANHTHLVQSHGPEPHPLP